jgi:putative alpha-1,2-mannosidase
MKSTTRTTLLGLVPLFTAAATSPADIGKQNYKLIDPLTGSYNGGNVFAGATLPFGMAKAVADVSGQNTAGFGYDGSNVTGFSALHDSGTGGQPSMGNFPLSIQYCDAGAGVPCKFGPRLDRAVDVVNGSVQAQPGYFSLKLANDMVIEMTTTAHTALYHFWTETDKPGPLVLLDLTDLQDSRQNASVSVDAETARIMGNGTFLPSFGVGSYQSYFCVDFEGASVDSTGIWVNDRAGPEQKDLFVNRGYSQFYIQAGAFVRFQKPRNGTIQARVGLSFISSQQACHNAETEIPDFDFDRVRTAAREVWEQKMSGVEIQPGGASEALQRTFFSGIYRTMISPQNYTGENPLWQSAAPYFDSFYWYELFCAYVGLC